MPGPGAPAVDPRLPPGFSTVAGLPVYTAHPGVSQRLPGRTLEEKVQIWQGGNKSQPQPQQFYQAPVEESVTVEETLPTAPEPSAASLYVAPPADYRPGIDPMWDYFSTTNQYPSPIAEETVAYEAPTGDGGYREAIENIYSQSSPLLADYFPSWQGQGALGTLLATPSTILEETYSTPAYTEAVEIGTEPYTVL